MKREDIRKVCVQVFEGFVVAGKREATSQDFADELVTIYPSFATMASTGLAKSIGDSFGEMNLPCVNRSYPKIYDLRKIHVVDGDLRWKIA